MVYDPEFNVKEFLLHLKWSQITEFLNASQLPFNEKIFILRDNQQYLLKFCLLMTYKKNGDFITKMMDTNFQKISVTWKNLIFGIHEPAQPNIQRQVECKNDYSAWWLEQCSFL